MIIVGIGYERGLIPWLFTRVRDFSPTEDPSFNYNNPSFKIPESGKADNFLKFIKEELQPKLESKYRTDSEMNIVASHSMSALFAVYEMFQSKRFFHKYIIACPFIEWDGDTVFRMEELFPVFIVLKLIEIKICPFTFNKFIMAPFFYQLSFVKNKDPVCMTDG